jgi:hypothetical protein
MVDVYVCVRQNALSNATTHRNHHDHEKKEEQAQEEKDTITPEGITPPEKKKKKKKKTTSDIPSTNKLVSVRVGMLVSTCTCTQADAMQQPFSIETRCMLDARIFTHTSILLHVPRGPLLQKERARARETRRARESERQRARERWRKRERARVRLSERGSERERGRKEGRLLRTVTSITRATYMINHLLLTPAERG